MTKFVFDIDGTVCDNTFGDYEHANPILERIKIINSLYSEGHTIFFYTARGMGSSNNNSEYATINWREFTEKQLKSWGLKYHSLFMGKPSADIYIDDKGQNDMIFFESFLD
jgi:hypothetical protein